MTMIDLIPWNWFKTDTPLIQRNAALSKNIQDMESLIYNFLMETNKSGFKFLPRVDVYDKEKEYVVIADLPGVKAEDLEMSIYKDGILTIKGCKENKEEKNERNYHYLERSYGSFERSIALPNNCDTKNVTSSLKDGILTITFPKKEQIESEVQRIKLPTNN